MASRGGQDQAPLPCHPPCQLGWSKDKILVVSASAQRPSWFSAFIHQQRLETAHRALDGAWATTK